MKRDRMKKRYFLKLIVSVIFISVLLSVFGFFYAFKIEPHRLILREYNLSAPQLQGTPLTIVQFSDTELTKAYGAKDLQKIVQKINQQNPDIVVFTGDLYNNYSQFNSNQITELLSTIQATYGKFAIYGNKDYGGGAGHHYQTIMTTAGFQVLDNQSQLLTTINQQQIFIGGVDDQLLGNPNPDAVLAGLMNTTEKPAYAILLAHEPEMADQVQDYPINLVLSGHTHGGQVKLPFLENPLIPLHNDDSGYVNGFYQLNQEADAPQLYVDSGLGTSRLAVRFLTPPQITVFHLMPKDESLQTEG